MRLPAAHRPLVVAIVVTVVAVASTALEGSDPPNRVGRSPWGPDDQIGTLNMMTPESRSAILARADARRLYDLSVDYFVGMPSWHLLGDPRYQFWLTHTPRGTAVDDPVGVGRAGNDAVAYTGDAISMYTHTGTHIDALNHFGLHGEIWNGFTADEHLGDRGWRKAGVEAFPPIVARGVLIDVAAHKGAPVLPDGYRITRADLEEALAAQGTTLAPGDVVMIRGGRMTTWPDVDAYVLNQPGLSLEAARWLAETRYAMVIGGDNLSLEHFPVESGHSWIPVHTYLLAQRGIPIVEVVNLEELSHDRVYEFAFIAASLRFRGASAAPFRPIAMPLVPAAQAAARRADPMGLPVGVVNLPGRTDDAPYSDAVATGGAVYLAGRLGLDPATGHPPADPAREVQLILDGIRAVLAQAGLAMDDLVSVQVFTTDVGLLDTFNSVYRGYFSAGYPARAFVGAGPLLFGARFEVQAVAIPGSRGIGRPPVVTAPSVREKAAGAAGHRN